MINGNFLSGKLETKPLQTIYKNLGLEDRGRVQQYLGKKVADNLKAYVSFDSGVQEAQTKSIESGKKVKINIPYAHFQSEGKAMVGVRTGRAWAKSGERKIYSGKALKYHSSFKRGKHPFERMKADKAQSILKEVAEYARRISDG